jgi:hypothetical protein
MKILFFILFVLVGSTICLAQPDSAKIKETIYNSVYKNVAAFYIERAVKSKTDISNGFLYPNLDKYFFDLCLPNTGFRMMMEINKLDWEYPIDGYHVYRIKLNGLTFKSDSLRLIETTLQIDGPPGGTATNYLLCINDKGVIKFISGNYFLHDVSRDFKLDDKSPESYVKYLKFRTFEDQIDQITYLKRKRGNLIFTGYSTEFKRKVQLSVNIKKPGTVEITL